MFMDLLTHKPRGLPDCLNLKVNKLVPKKLTRTTTDDTQTAINRVVAWHISKVSIITPESCINVLCNWARDDKVWILRYPIFRERHR